MTSMADSSFVELEKFPTLDPPTIEITAEKEEAPDAGLRSVDHYKRRLSPWRFKLRQKLLPIIRWETPYLALLQNKMRTPALDSYFAITANLGTHTFFMVVLPILFWCGHTSLGRGMVHILASGVFFTGFVKDFFSLPRPLSPPLHRITMSGYAALEYGFPSTHSANAVSVAVYALFSLHSPDCALQPGTKLFVESLSYFYAFSIVLGRLYCGMHGFTDVVVGSLMGALISIFECVYGPVFDQYLYSSSWFAPMLFGAIIITLVRVHPEPVDDCPCFDDSVAFAGVMIGVELGGWHYASTFWSWDTPVPATVPFDLAAMGWTVVMLRIVVGVLSIFAWREVMKPTLLKWLPHLFRVIERMGLILPRRFFMPASEYYTVPNPLKDDNVMPSVSELPHLLESIRHPSRGRSISVGPQSAADAYETLAYREKRRRESVSSLNSLSGQMQADIPEEQAQEEEYSQVSGFAPARSLGVSSLPTPAQSKVTSYEHMMGQGTSNASPPPAGSGDEEDTEDPTWHEKNDLGEKEIFSRIAKPRVRYDVEVVTKLVVYAGIGWLAVEVNPILFEILGLGMGTVSYDLKW